MATRTHQPYRSLDYAYDPLFTVSGGKDAHKAAIIAKLSIAKYQLCPIFANMFTESPKYPTKQLVRRKSAPPINFMRHYQVQQGQKNKRVDVLGADRAKYHYYPKIDSSVGKSRHGSPRPVPQLQMEVPRSDKKQKNKKNRKIQTQFRESSAQTSPWEPPYSVVDQGDPELLMLDFLKWGSGLPAGMHEIQLIERARMKRAWEEKLRSDDQCDLNKQRDIVEAMERDEWAFREQEIQDIQDLRLKLLEKMLEELHEKSRTRTEQKLESFSKMRLAQRDDQLKKLSHKAQRELRKLQMMEIGVNKKYHPVNVVTEHADHTSDLYGPQIRFGENPSHWHQMIDESMKRFRAQFIGVEEFSTLPKWLNLAAQMKDCQCIKLPGTRLCMRETKWTTPVLKLLHEELKNLSKQTKRPLALRTRIEQPPSECSTPEVEGIPDVDEDFYQAILMMQAVLKGRAAQTVIYEGRDRCRELIKELKFSHGLLEQENSVIHDQKLAIKLEQRKAQGVIDKMCKLQENLKKLEGEVVGSLLDFLNKELRRLLEERRAHAMCILLERERYDREAAEAGRRQLELRRRREHDEMFKQIVKVHQDTVDVYLEDIIREGMEWTSEHEAREYIKGLAKKIDEEACKFDDTQDIDEQEEMVANLVHHFVLPEVEKEIVRNKIKAQQKENLRTVHDAIFTEIEEVGSVDLRSLDEGPHKKGSITRKSSSEIELAVTEVKKADSLADEITQDNSESSQTAPISEDVIEIYEESPLVQHEEPVQDDADENESDSMEQRQSNIILNQEELERDGAERLDEPISNDADNLESKDTGDDSAEKEEKQ